MAIRFHPHARERMRERGAYDDEVSVIIEQGEQFPAKFSRTEFRRNFNFDSEWHGKYYKNKQIEVFAVRENTDWVVINVVTRCF